MKVATDRISAPLHKALEYINKSLEIYKKIIDQNGQTL